MMIVFLLAQAAFSSTQICTAAVSMHSSEHRNAPSERVSAGRPLADTSRVTSQYLDLHVTIATGTDSRGRTRVIITPGTDLAGATAHILPDTAHTEPFPDRTSMIVEPIRFELFDGDSVITAESWYRVSGPVPFGIPGETRPMLVDGTYDHRRTDLVLGQDTVPVFLQNDFTDGSYDHQKSRLFVGHPPTDRPVTP